MTIIGLDYGSKNVGLSASDENETMAFPVRVIASSNTLLDELKKLAEEKKANTFVLGESKNYQGDDNEIMKEITALKKSLEKEGFVVHLEPEFMTSAEARHIQGENKMIDASAAAIILQSFLNKHDTNQSI